MDNLGSSFVALFVFLGSIILTLPSRADYLDRPIKHD
jgi:hypothetical protein